VDNSASVLKWGHTSYETYDSCGRNIDDQDGG